MTTPGEGQSRLFSIRMRASGGPEARHISGAERIVPAAHIPDVAHTLATRALCHEKGRADAMHITVEALTEPCLRLDALPARALACHTPSDGLQLAMRLLLACNVPRAFEILALMHVAPGMHGALLVDADSLKRLEPVPERGVRATRMDEVWTGGRECLHKDHYREAVILATKVAHAPGIVAEVCISDDPDYVTGYVASRELGYVRLQTMKNRGNPAGGRIFLYRGAPGDVAATIRFLEHTPVLVANIPPKPDFVPPSEGGLLP